MTTPEKNEEKGPFGDPVVEIEELYPRFGGVCLDSEGKIAVNFAWKNGNSFFITPSFDRPYASFLWQHQQDFARFGLSVGRIRCGPCQASGWITQHNNHRYFISSSSFLTSHTNEAFVSFELYSVASNDFRVELVAKILKHTSVWKFADSDINFLPTPLTFGRPLQVNDSVVVMGYSGDIDMKKIEIYYNSVQSRPAGLEELTPELAISAFHPRLKSAAPGVVTEEGFANKIVTFRVNASIYYGMAGGPVFAENGVSGFVISGEQREAPTIGDITQGEIRNVLNNYMS